MTDVLEQELRAALAEHAAAMQADDALRRLGASHFTPPERRVPFLRPAASASAAALVAAVIVAVVLLSSGARARHPNAPVAHPSVPAAYVGWTPVPGKGTANRIAEYAKRCRWAASHKSTLGPPLIGDVRGPYTAILFVDERDNYERFCIYGPHVGGQGSGEIRSPLPFDGPPGRDGIQHSGMNGSCDPADGRAVGEMHGQVGVDVTGATFAFPNGASVEASVTQGYYFVWWPWANQPKAITLYTTTGTTRITLRSGPRSNWC